MLTFCFISDTADFPCERHQPLLSTPVRVRPPNILISKSSWSCAHQPLSPSSIGSRLSFFLLGLSHSSLSHRSCSRTSPLALSPSLLFSVSLPIDLKPLFPSPITCPHYPIDYRSEPLEDPIHWRRSGAIGGRYRCRNPLSCRPLTSRASHPLFWPGLLLLSGQLFFPLCANYY